MDSNLDTAKEISKPYSTESFSLCKAIFMNAASNHEIPGSDNG
jgi:hypothetical protein